MEENIISQEQAFPIDDQERFTITIVVRKNVISHQIRWPNMDDENTQCPLTIHEILGALEYAKQVLGINHGNYVKEAYKLKMATEESLKKQEQQPEK